MHLSKKLGINQIPHLLKNKNILMRVDFNVPMKQGKVFDAKKIVSTLPSINYLLENHAKSVILMSHLGRPHGTRTNKYSLEPLVPVLQNLLNKKITWVDDCLKAEKICRQSKNGEIILLENLRFYKEEEGVGLINGEKRIATFEEIDLFRKKLTAYGDIFVNDAFGTAHRAHSYMVGINLETKAAGLLMKKELQYFSKVVENPVRPLIVIMGGAKINDKIKCIYNLLDIVDEMIIGGGMAFTFNKILNGTRIGSSLFD